MIYTNKIQEAIHFAIEVHELNRATRQLRKGKEVAYITHPLTVGLILSQAECSEEVVIAGILHDTIEDCEPKGLVTKSIISNKFDAEVAELVDSVTEKDKGLSWHERKEAALEEIRQFSHDSLLVKSGDVISNVTELLNDYNADGDKTFERFNADKEDIIHHTLQVIGTIINNWPESPLLEDLKTAATKLQTIGAVDLMTRYPAMNIPYKEYSESMNVFCPVCGWSGLAKNADINTDSEFCLDVSCPICEKMILVANYPSAY